MVGLAVVKEGDRCTVKGPCQFFDRRRSMKKDPNKGYIALLGWSLNAVEAAEKFDRRYVVVAPDWAEPYCQEHDIPYVPWNFERLNDRSLEIAQTLKDMGVDVSVPLFEETV